LRWLHSLLLHWANNTKHATYYPKYHRYNNNILDEIPLKFRNLMKFPCLVLEFEFFRPRQTSFVELLARTSVRYFDKQQCRPPPELHIAGGADRASKAKRGLLLSWLLLRAGCLFSIFEQLPV
jgi:hypothetical protein